MLRTVMWSTRANRNYGPPDGIQPESLICWRCQLVRLMPDRRTSRDSFNVYLYRRALGRVSRKSAAFADRVPGSETLQHNSSSRKVFGKLFCELVLGANGVPRAGASRGSKRCARSMTATHAVGKTGLPCGIRSSRVRLQNFSFC